MQVICGVAQSEMIHPCIRWSVTFGFKPWKYGYDGTLQTTNRIARFENSNFVIEIDLTNDIDGCSVELDRYEVVPLMNGVQIIQPVIEAPDELYEWLGERCDSIDDMFESFEETGVVDPELFRQIVHTVWEWEEV